MVIVDKVIMLNQSIAGHTAYGWTFYKESEFPHYQIEEQGLVLMHSFLENHRSFAYYVGAGYLLWIFILQKWMKEKKPFELKWTFVLWNVILGLFPLVAFYRTMPSFLYNLSQPNGFYKSICVKERMDVATAFWGVVFIYSKFFELRDTVFTILRKKPLHFAQWYHHLATLIVAWVAGEFTEPIARWYAVMNCGVHALMYPYFALRTAQVTLPKWISRVILTLELTQMFAGFGINMLSLYWLHAGHQCSRDSLSIKAFNVVYGSFIFVFGKLFYDYFYRSGKNRKITEKSL